MARRPRCSSSCESTTAATDPLRCARACSPEVACAAARTCPSPEVACAATRAALRRQSRLTAPAGGARAARSIDGAGTREPPQLQAPCSRRCWASSLQVFRASAKGTRNENQEREDRDGGDTRATRFQDRDS
ncbi:hypothetical protein PVAP13_7NG345333 [Panicum virgatum]|uniref:Uncharacterized protein n=1 Tax=Panicum virgatum TaxID=38727 RepID=A0A8T0Q3Y8_PANVG|nr:hypothetical protein PVAP13_7NG345333 [Panicum virgatum]